LCHDIDFIRAPGFAIPSPFADSYRGLIMFPSVRPKVRFGSIPLKKSAIATGFRS
jgi:hypothetical protein